MIEPKTYTPKQVADILQLSKATVYKLINQGEIIAKKIGSVYRIPRKSLSFAFTGLDYDLYSKQQKDIENIEKVHQALSEVRKNL